MPFISQEVWFDKGFVIRNFLNVVVITQYWSSNHFYHLWIGTQNKQIEIKCIPEYLRRRTFIWKIRCRLDFSWNKMRCRHDLSNKMRRRPHFFSESWWVVCNIDIVYNQVSTHHSSECCFFNSCMNLFMNSLNFGRPTVILFSLLRTRYQEESTGRPTGRSIA